MSSISSTPMNVDVSDSTDSQSKNPLPQTSTKRSLNFSNITNQPSSDLPKTNFDTPSYSYLVSLSTPSPVTKTATQVNEFMTLCPNFTPSDTEPLTQASWTDLYASAVKKNLPYYVIGLVRCKKELDTDKPIDLYKPYDAIAITGWMKNNNLETLTRKKIASIDFFALECFTLVGSDKINHDFDIQRISKFFPFSSLGVAKKITCWSENKKNQISVTKIALDACNHHSENNKSLGICLKLIGDQLILSKSKLLIPEALKWYFSAAEQGNEDAREELSTIQKIFS